jgi:carboxyl-terminal processing protease
MNMGGTVRLMTRGLSDLVLAGCVLAGFALAGSGLANEAKAQAPDMSKQPAMTDAPSQPTGGGVAPDVERVWQAARSGTSDDLLAALGAVTQTGQGPGVDALNRNLTSLQANIAKREATRLTKFNEAQDKFLKEWEKAQQPGAEEHRRWKALSESVRRVVEMHTLSREKKAFLAETRTQDVVRQAESAAREAEAKGDWFTANEIFFRLGALFDEEGTYRPDVRRLSLRLSMIRLYAPELFWKLRNEERVESGKSPLPPYNGLGEDWREKVAGIDRVMVLKGIFSANDRWIKGAKMSELMRGGIESLRTMVSTSDLAAAFPGIGNAAARDGFLAMLDQQSARLEPNAEMSRGEVADMLEAVLQAGKSTVGLSEQVVLHEFGNGAMGRLDEFTAMIWPDELMRFDRMTQGTFIGVGVQIQIDDETQMVKVVTPIEGTPAQRAGIRQGDLIKKIDGQSAVGVSLNQAIDKITGQPGTRVVLTMERAKAEKDGEGNDVAKDIDFPLIRQRIPIHTVKGWERNGPREIDFNWLIDAENRIGYVRMSQFTEDTTRDLHKAVEQMRAQSGPAGLGGMILDLRFNPGGLLTEAVTVASTFLSEGTIVSTKGTMPAQSNSAQPGLTRLAGVPTVILVNEGSASASEIVAGALRHYSDAGKVPVIVIGQRSFGKGSVQNVWPLANNAKMKLTTQYYYLPDGRLLHKEPGAREWGVDPHLRVEDLFETQSEALKLRQDADVLPVDQTGKIVENAAPRPSPNKLLDDGLDLQLQHALAILQARALAPMTEQARLP